MGDQFHFHPQGYLDLMTSEMPDYFRLQDEAAAATGTGAARLLELGTGTGETARRVLASHPGATLVGIDASADMLAVARSELPGADLRVARLQDPLPPGPFDLVFSVLAIHHLNGPGKADLFRRVADVVIPGGRFVIGDVVMPDDPADAVTPLSPDYDLPSRADEQLAWLSDAGFEASLAWVSRDLAVMVGRRRANCGWVGQQCSGALPLVRAPRVDLFGLYSNNSTRDRVTSANAPEPPGPTPSRPTQPQLTFAGALRRPGFDGAERSPDEPPRRGAAPRPPKPTRW